MHNTLIALVGTSVEVIVHAGNIRCAMIDRLQYDEASMRFIVTSCNGSYVRFDSENVLKVLPGFRTAIYVA